MLEIAANPVWKRPAGSRKASPPRDESALVALLSIAKSIRAIYGLKLAAIDFHNGQDELLLALNGEGTTVSVLADQLQVRPSTVSKMLDRLTAKGLVKRTDDKVDARRTLVRITSSGEEVRKTLIELRRSVDEELAKALNGSSGAASGDGSDAVECLAASAAALGRHLRRLR